MRWHGWCALGALWLAGAPAMNSTFAAPGPTAQDDQLDEAFVALEDEYDEAYADWRRAYSEASKRHREARATNPDAAFDGPERIEPTFFPRFDRLASAGSWKAKSWCLSKYSSDAPKDEQRRDFTRRVLDLMVQPGADLATLPRTISSFSNGRLLDKDAGQALLRVLETVTDSKSVAASAAYMSAGMIASRRDQDDAKKKAQLAAYRRIAKMYPDEAYGQRAGGAVFKAEKLQIGMVAPDIVGADVDGNPMKLTDFRGKVTVIDFWGFW